MEHKAAQDNLDFSHSTSRRRVVDHGRTQLQLALSCLRGHVVLVILVVAMAMDFSSQILVERRYGNG